MQNRWRSIALGLMLIVGSVLFLDGGRAHPRTGTQMGLGTPEYFETFIHHVQHTPTWEVMHTKILSGPVLWAIAAAAFMVGIKRQGARGWQEAGSVCFAIGATCWIVAFLFDGYAAPYVAQQWAAASDAVLAKSILVIFGMNQTMVIKSGLASWILMGVGTASLGVVLLRSQVLSPVRSHSLGWVAVALGTWPLLAWATGIFSPGPFTSAWWNPTAILTAVWYAALGTQLIFLRTHEQ
jgi:hypothetical protein